MTIRPSTPLEHLYRIGLLTERALAALYTMGIRSVGGLMVHRERRRFTPYNFSVEALSDIEDLLKKFDSGDIVIKYNVNPNDDGAKGNPRRCALDKAKADRIIKEDARGFKKDAHVFKKIYMLMAYEAISRLHGDAAQYVRQLFPDAMTMHDAILNKSYDVLTVHGDLGRTGNIKVRKLLLLYLKTVQKYLFKSRIFDRWQQRVIWELLETLGDNVDKFDAETVINDFLSASQRKDLFCLFGALCDGLSPAAREFQRKSLPGLTDAMRLFGLPEGLLAGEYPFMPGRAVLHEVWQMVQTLEEAVMDELYSGYEEKLKARVSYAFPWLSFADQHFVFRFYLDYGSMPLFYITQQFLRHSSSREIGIYALINGIKDGVKHGFLDVAAERSLTRSRIGQMYLDGQRFSKAAMEQYISWGDYASLLDSNLITALSPQYRMIQESERLPDDFGLFCALLSVMGNFEVKTIGQETIALHRRISEFAHVTHIKNKLKNAPRKRRGQVTLFDIRPLVADVPEDVREDVLQIVCKVAVAYTGITPLTTTIEG